MGLIVFYFSQRMEKLEGELVREEEKHDLFLEQKKI